MIDSTRQQLDIAMAALERITDDYAKGEGGWRIAPQRWQRKRSLSSFTTKRRKTRRQRMAAYVDELQEHPRGNRHGHHWSHLMADTIRELHAFAKAIGVNRCWFHSDHYDLNPAQRAAAVRAGAKEVTARDLVLIRRSLTDPRKGLHAGRGS
jgi:hypothetical protein